MKRPAVRPSSRIPANGRILYFARDSAAFGAFSHFHPAPIRLDGETWPSAEHYYQAQKALDPAYRAAVLAAATPAKAKRMAAIAQPDADASDEAAPRRLRAGALLRPDWDAVKLDVMRKVDTAKFEQNARLGQLLLSTADAELVEDSPYDAFWGTGPNGDGANWAGRVLMEVRQSLRG